MPCLISYSRIAAALAAVPALTPEAAVEVIGAEAREAIGGDRLAPAALAAAAATLRIGLVGLGVPGEESDRLADRLRELLVT
jgi:hypothetical protein